VILTKTFICAGYIPAKLPISCLTVAPRFDAMAAKESLTMARKPLIEINREYDEK
jgi:polo-like kinase 1